MDEFKQHLPLLSALCNPGLRERHWVRMTEIAGQELKPSAVRATGRHTQLCTQGPCDCVCMYTCQCNTVRTLQSHLACVLEPQVGRG